MSVPDMIRRQEAMNRTIKKYRHSPFSWESDANCIQLAWFHMRQMGHRTPELPKFRTPLGALRALKKYEFADCAAVLDSIKSIRRIQPAMMLMGDLATIKGGIGKADENEPEDQRAAALALAEVGAVVICMGPHKVLGWREDADKMVVLDVSFADFQAAWRL